MSERRFKASVNCEHRETLTIIMARVPVGGGTVVITPKEDVDLRNLAGGLNEWATAPGGCGVDVNVWAEIPYGDYARRLWAASTSVVDVFPFRVPANGLVHIAMSENGGQPWDRLLTISAVAGDLDAPIRSQGKVPDLWIGATTEWPAGTLLYANTILMQEPTVPNSSGTGISAVWPAP